jgi:hypothetical protein
MTLIGVNALIVGYGLREWQLTHTVTPDRSLAEGQASRNRQAMIEKVRVTWIVGVLNQSLYQETRIALGLHTHPDAVARPMDVLVQRPHHTTRALPLNKPISEVYDELNGTMLILGAPGAGKTTLLLELTRDLLDRARQDLTHPIPVVFPLSSWAEQRRPLADWLVEELHLRYDVPRAIAQTWIDAHTILPLLDGLDEVAQEHRATCVDAINAFRQAKYGLLPLVVSSRIADYDALTVKLRLDGAIVVQPLTPEQVRDYLRQVGIHVAPSSTSPLWELLDSPLMLNIATLAYAERSGAAVRLQEVHQDQLFAAYVQRMFQRNSPQLRFSQEHTVQWLSWLAWQMQRHNQTVFYIERMQPSWLPRRQRWLPTVGVGLIQSLAFGLTVGLVVGRILGLVFGLIVGLCTVLGVGLDSTYPEQSTDIASVRWSWSKVRSELWRRVGTGLLIGLISGLAVGRVLGLSVGVSVGLVVGLILGLIGEGGNKSSRQITSVESVRWSWSKVRSKLRVIVGFGLTAGLVFGLIFGLNGGLTVGLIFGLAFGLDQGLSYAEVETKSIPNQGIRRSARNALGLGLVYGQVYGLGVGLIVGLVHGLSAGLVFGPVGGLAYGLVVGLDYGGTTCLQHFVLRRLLVRNGSAPWHYVDFLDYAASRIFLRKVGGGYIFIHRMLLEYFAKQYKGPETIELRAPGEGN